MSDQESSSHADDRAAAPQVTITEAAPPPALAPSTPAVTVAGHEILFAPEGARACDACGGEVEADEGHGFAVPGAGVYLRARGDDVQRESVPLCPACAAAIGMTAFARWDLEDDEG